MGGLLNTTYHDTVDKITEFNETLVNNSFYTLNDKKPIIGTYFNINKDFSSLDPGSKLQYSNIGPDSPIRFNKIEGMLLYGFQKVELQTSSDEFGLEADNIEGDLYILPNTIVPYEGDYFEVNHIKDSTYLFMVTDVQKDTLDNGSNAYRIHYKLECINHDLILSKVVYNYKVVEVKEGTNFVSIVRCEDYEIAKLMDDKAVMLKSYYNNLFYNDKVQTYTYMDLTEFRVYDPFMIEFLIRNKILENGDIYINVSHQICIPTTFAIDYSKSIYRVFEECEKEDILSCKKDSPIELLKSYGTTFSARYENYYKATYNKSPGYNFSVLDDALLYRIHDNNLRENYPTDEKDNTRIWENIIIKYFNNADITTEELDDIENLNLSESKEMFYVIPFLIFCLEKYIEKALK